MNQPKPDNTNPAPGALVDCPTCQLPAEITDRFTLDGVPGPVEHAKVVCVQRHWYTLPVDMLPPSAMDRNERREPSTPSGRTRG
jgi:hypothetical protein